MTQRIGHLAAALADGITLAADAFRHTRDELETLGLPDTTAKKLHALAKVYFGQTAFTGKQRTARDNAHTRGHSLATLLAIEGYTRRLKHHRDKWALRIFATSLTGTTSQ